MLSIKQSESAAGAVKYFSEELSRGDYYSARGELPGIWHGKAAEALGLSGEVTREQFAALAFNQHPATGERITARNVENRRPGYDLTFGAPKTVTVLYNYLLEHGRQEQADALLGAFHGSVRETMEDVEASMQARVRDGGRNENRTTGNLAWAGFTHFQARPVADAANDNWTDAYADPHLHQHCYVFNLTRDDAHAGKNKWKAGEFGQLHEDRVYYQALFFDRLATKLGDLGYATERQSVSFELAGFARATVEKFSRRAEQVRRDAAGKGITSARGKRELAAITRAEKDEGVAPEETARRFYAKLDDEERATLSRIAGGGSKPPSGGGMGASEALDHAFRHSFERLSVVNEKRLVAEALMHSLGSGLSSGIHEALATRQEALRCQDANGQGVVTTREALANDAAIAEFAGRAQLVPSFAERRAARGLGEYVFSRAWLADEQKQAVRHVLDSNARVIAVRGGAGTGKTTAMQETAEAIAEATGKRVVVVAPTGRASHGTLREDGFAEADTLARLLQDTKMQEGAKGGVIYVDEAGLIGSRTLRKLFELAARLDARVILQGDTRQHGSVEAGDALRFLEERAGLAFAELRQVRRQEDAAYREAVETIAAGRIGEGFQKLDAMGAVHEAAREELPARIADAYLHALDNAPNAPRTKVAHIVAPRHADAEPITARVREGLKARGKLGEAREFSRLFATGWTEAQRGAAYNYRPGQVVEFLQNASGHTKGERLTVLDVREGTVWALQGTGERAGLVAVPLEQAQRFQVYEQRALELGQGDSVRITAGGKDAHGRRINTGEVYTLQGFDTDGALLLGKKDGEISRKLATRDALGNRSALHLAHGYVSTSHAAQGATVNHVFIAQGADAFAASSREQFYVSVSRGRHSVHVFTDDKEALARAIGRSGARLFASDVADRRLKAKLPDAPRPPVKAAEPGAQASSSEAAPAAVRGFRYFLDASVELIESIALKARSAARAVMLAAELRPALAATPSTDVTGIEARRLRPERGRGR